MIEWVMYILVSFVVWNCQLVVAKGKSLMLASGHMVTKCKVKESRRITQSSIQGRRGIGREPIFNLKISAFQSWRV